MKKTLGIVTTVALATTMANAELVGSFHLPANGMNTGKILQSTNNVPTRTSNGNSNTRGTVEGSFSCQAGALIGSGGSTVYTGMGLKTFSGTTQFLNTERYGGSTPAALVWDFDLSGITTNAWDLKVDFDKRDGDNGTQPAKWYVSFTGLGRTLDTTDVTTLTPGDGIAALVADPAKYIYIGELPATVLGTEIWDLTDVVEAAQAEGAGLIRLVMTENSYLEDIHFKNDSGLIASAAASGEQIEIPYFFLQDNFETGTATSTNGALVNGWFTDGPENKEYNVASSGSLDVRDAYLGSEVIEGSNTVHNGSFENVYINFPDIALTNDGDWLELSVDLQWYEDTSGAVLNDVGGLLANFNLTDSGRTNNAGYGFRVKKELYHSLSSFETANAFPTEVTNSVTSREAAATNDTFQTWTLRIERAGENFLLSPAIDGNLFGPSTNKVTTFTNNVCIDAVFDQLTFSVRGKDVGMKIDNVAIISNKELIVLTPYQQWAESAGLTNGNSAATDNPDGDSLNNRAEYVFGGDPLDDTDIGTQPVFNAVNGDYIYVLRNDDALVASVLTREDLLLGDWETNETISVTLDDGGLGSYTNSVGISTNQLFIKLRVD